MLGSYHVRAPGYYVNMHFKNTAWASSTYLKLEYCFLNSTSGCYNSCKYAGIKGFPHILKLWTSLSHSYIFTDPFKSNYAAALSLLF